MADTRDSLPYYFVGLDRDGRYLAECASLNVKLKAGSFEEASTLIALCIRGFCSPYATAQHHLRSGLVYALMAIRKIDAIAA